MRYRITRNDGLFTCITDDPTALQPEWGKPAWTETIPAYTDTTVDPPVDHPEQVIEHPSEFTVSEVPLDQPEAIARAWAAADAFAQAGMDTNSRTSLLWLAMDPSCPAWRMQRVLAVQAWWAGVWAHYAQVKASIQAGVDTNFDPAIPGQCPWTIWQIAGSEP